MAIVYVVPGSALNVNESLKLELRTALLQSVVASDPLTGVPKVAAAVVELHVVGVGVPPVVLGGGAGVRIPAASKRLRIYVI